MFHAAQHPPDFPIGKICKWLPGSAGGDALESGSSNWKHGNAGEGPEMMLGLKTIRFRPGHSLSLTVY